MYKTLLLSLLAVSLYACGEKTEEQKDKSETSKKELSETSKTTCESFFQKKLNAQKPLEVSGLKSAPIDEVKIAFNDPELKANTAYVTSLTIDTKDSTHHCSCYIDQSGELIGNTTFSESKSPAPSQQEIAFKKFKNAVLSKDKAIINSMNKIEGVDADMILLYFEDPAFSEKLKAFNFSDLEVTDYNGTPVKELSIELRGSDESGEVYETGIFIYFKETADGLEVVNLLAAG